MAALAPAFSAATLEKYKGAKPINFRLLLVNLLLIGGCSFVIFASISRYNIVLNDFDRIARTDATSALDIDTGMVWGFLERSGKKAQNRRVSISSEGGGGGVPIRKVLRPASAVGLGSGAGGGGGGGGGGAQRKKSTKQTGVYINCRKIIEYYMNH